MKQEKKGEQNDKNQKLGNEANDENANNQNVGNEVNEENASDQNENGRSSQMGRQSTFREDAQGASGSGLLNTNVSIIQHTATSRKYS